MKLDYLFQITREKKYINIEPSLGDTFKWISGNEGYIPDSYWIIFLQYSQETAYFRGQLRKADDLIEVVAIGEDGEEGSPVLYQGWTVGPNEKEDVWNIKKAVVWNDLYYHKLLYITKKMKLLMHFLDVLIEQQ